MGQAPIDRVKRAENQMRKLISSGGIAISAGFKCGTCTLEKTFNCFKTHNMPFVIRENHSEEVFRKIKTILVPFRANEEVYPSALFQDIVNLSYPYCPFKGSHFLAEYEKKNEEERKSIILNTHAKKILKHFEKINWDRFGHLNSKFRLEQINKRFNIRIDYYSDDVQTFLIPQEDGSVKKLISFNSKNLNRDFEKIKFEIYGVPREDIELVPFNLSQKKWYHSKYKEFLALRKQKKTMESVG